MIDGAGDGLVTHFSMLDLAKGFHQVPIEKNSQEMMAFVYPDGLMHWLYMPFRLKTCPRFFQGLMDHILHGLSKQKTECYIDDLLVKGTTFDDHVKTMKEILQRLSDAGMMISLSKCHFLQEQVSYLGYEVSAKGLLPGEWKVQALKHFLVPKNIKQLQGFHRLASDFRRFVRNFAGTAHPLMKLFNNGAIWDWGLEQQIAFQELKAALINAELLVFVSCNTTKTMTDSFAQWDMPVERCWIGKHDT